VVEAITLSLENRLFLSDEKPRLSHVGESLLVRTNVPEIKWIAKKGIFVCNAFEPELSGAVEVSLTVCVLFRDGVALDVSPDIFQCGRAIFDQSGVLASPMAVKILSTHVSPSADCNNEFNHAQSVPFMCHLPARRVPVNPRIF
jgi:hypothetical protein